jgi:hypothetical protein
VVRDEALCGYVELVKAEMLRGNGEGPDLLAGRKTLKLRDKDLDHEAATGFQVRGDVAEALNLAVLRGHVHDRVADQVGEPERPAHLGGGEVSDGHADAIGARFGLQVRDHGGRQFDPVHPETSLAQRQRDAPGSDAKLKSGTRPGQVREEVHRGINDRRLE